MVSLTLRGCRSWCERRSPTTGKRRGFGVRKFVILLAFAAGCPKAKDAPPAPQQPEVFADVPVTTTSAAALQAFREGQRFLDNVRMSDAAEKFKKAVELDPGFPQALAHHAMFVTGEERVKLMKKAVELASHLPKPERLLVQMIQARQQGDYHEVRGLQQELAQLVPRDWRVQLWAGKQAYHDLQWDKAIAILRRASELNPSAGEPHNFLAYSLAYLGRFDESLAALRKYAELLPGEPNPQDSVGEILMRAGRLDEAEEAFRKALRISPTFWPSWEATSIARFARGDWKGGREALRKAREIAKLPWEKLHLDQSLAMSYAAERKDAEWAAGLDAMERLAQELKVAEFTIVVPMMRAWSLVLVRAQPREALRSIAQAEKRLQASRLAKGERRGLSFSVALARTAALCALAWAVEAEKEIGRLEAIAARFADRPRMQSRLQMARGLLALARGDGNAAVRYFSTCLPDDSFCQYQLARAQERLRDAAGASATKQRLLRTIYREMDYIVVRAWLFGPGMR
jgi:tetratricopeptide (TPR) repeat protein